MVDRGSILLHACLPYFNFARKSKQTFWKRGFVWRVGYMSAKKGGNHFDRTKVLECNGLIFFYLRLLVRDSSHPSACFCPCSLLVSPSRARVVTVSRRRRRERFLMLSRAPTDYLYLEVDGGWWVRRTRFGFLVGLLDWTMRAEGERRVFERGELVKCSRFLVRKQKEERSGGREGNGPTIANLRPSGFTSRLV